MALKQLLLKVEAYAVSRGYDCVQAYIAYMSDGHWSVRVRESDGSNSRLFYQMSDGTPSHRNDPLYKELASFIKKMETVE